MSWITNQNACGVQGCLASGITAISTGNSIAVRGMNRFSFSVEGTPYVTSAASLTGRIEALVAPGQINWAPLAYACFNSSNSGTIFTYAGPLEAIRSVVSSYYTGAINFWYNGSQA